MYVCMCTEPGRARARTHAKSIKSSKNYVHLFRCDWKLHIHVLRKCIIHVASSQLKLFGEKWDWNSEYDVNTLFNKFIFAILFVCCSNFMHYTGTFFSLFFSVFALFVVLKIYFFPILIYLWAEVFIKVLTFFLQFFIIRVRNYFLMNLSYAYF